MVEIIHILQNGRHSSDIVEWLLPVTRLLPAPSTDTPLSAVGKQND